MVRLAGWPLYKRITQIRRQRRQGPERLAALTSQRLRQALAWAAKAPLYGERLAGLDLDAAEPGDLGKIKPLTKAEQQARLADSFAAPGVDAGGIRHFTARPEYLGRLYQGRYIAAHGSGSSGRPGWFLQDMWGWRVGQALNARGVLDLVDGARLGRPRLPWRVALITPARRHLTSLLTGMITTLAWSLAARVRYLDVMDPVGKLVGELNQQRPQWLHAYPTVLAALAAARRAGSLEAEPVLITASSEPFTPAVRAALKRAWPQALLGETYSATEATPLAWSCPLGRLHLNIDWFIIEPVDSRNRRLAPGSMGSAVLITHLFNRVQPLIRYRLEDRVRLVPEPCLCGSPLPVIELGGRAEDDLLLPRRGRGTVRLLPLPLITALEDCPAASQLQVVQTGERALSVYFTTQPGGDARRACLELRVALERYLQRMGVSPNLFISVEPRGELLRDAKSHKLRQVINRWDKRAAT